MAREIQVMGGPLTDIEIGLTGEREVVQNICVILATVVGELYLDRDFGIDINIVDMPMNLARQRMRAEVFEKIARYEPRAKVTKVDFAEPGLAESADGRLVPVVTFTILDETDL